jgi:hypothetical protein
MLHFQSPLSSVSTVPGEWAPHLVSQRGLYEERCPFPEPSFTHLSKPPQKTSSPDKTESHLSLTVQSKGDPPPCSLSGSPMERDAPFPEPVVYSFIRISQSPQLRSCPMTKGEDVQSLSTEPNADGRPTCSGVWPGSPRHCCYYPSAMQPSAQYLSPWLG